MREMKVVITEVTYGDSPPADIVREFLDLLSLYRHPNVRGDADVCVSASAPSGGADE